MNKKMISFFTIFMILSFSQLMVASELVNVIGLKNRIELANLNPNEINRIHDAINRCRENEIQKLNHTQNHPNDVYQVAIMTICLPCIGLAASSTVYEAITTSRPIIENELNNILLERSAQTQTINRP